MEQKRPADIFQELLDFLWNGLGLEEKGWKKRAGRKGLEASEKGRFKKKNQKNGMKYMCCYALS